MSMILQRDARCINSLVKVREKQIAILDVAMNFLLNTFFKDLAFAKAISVMARLRKNRKMAMFNLLMYCGKKLFVVDIHIL